MSLPPLSHAESPNPIQIGLKIIGLLVMISVILYILTITGTIKCGSAPFFCDIYYGIQGNPRVLIAYGDDGLGDPDKLQMIFQDRVKGLGIPVSKQHIRNLGPGNITNYDLVIVTRARTMSTEKIKMFIDYGIFGGKLVWTGDAGTELAKDEKGSFLYKDEDPDLVSEGEQPHELVNPWARKLNNEIVSLDKFLGINFVKNYCEIGSCSSKQNIVGIINPLDNDHGLIRGISTSLVLKIYDESGFSVVSPSSSGVSTIVLVTDIGSKISKDEITIGPSLPLIVTSSKSKLLGMNLGENVAYYSMPLEYYFDPNLKEEFGYYFVEQLYYYMFYGVN